MKERPLRIKNNAHLSSRKRRQKEYSETQRFYKKSRKAVYNSIISDTSLSDDPDPEIVFSYWRNLLSRPDYTVPPEHNPSDEKLYFCQLIQLGEVLASKMSFNTGCGPDGLTTKEANMISIRQKAKLFSIWLRLKWIPDFIITSKTIFIPKEDDVKLPSKLRPITIANVLIRHFHKILAARLSNSIKFHKFPVWLSVP